jgi:hypothetical protein
VSEDENNGEGTIEEEADGFACDVEILEEAVEDAVTAKDGFPGVTANEIADPEGDNDELIEQLFARTRVERQIVGERIAEQEREECDRSGDAHGAKKDLSVDGIREKRFVVGEIPFADDEAIVDGPKAMSEHEGVRKQQEEAHPEEWREVDDRFVSSRVHFSCQISVTSFQ